MACRELIFWIGKGDWQGRKRKPRLPEASVLELGGSLKQPIESPKIASLPIRFQCYRSFYFVPDGKDKSARVFVNAIFFQGQASVISVHTDMS